MKNVKMTAVAAAALLAGLCAVASEPIIVGHAGGKRYSSPMLPYDNIKHVSYLMSDSWITKQDSQSIYSAPHNYYKLTYNVLANTAPYARTGRVSITTDHAYWEQEIYQEGAPAYTIAFAKNDGSDERREVLFAHGIKTRIPSLGNGLRWTRAGYNFGGWATSRAKAYAGMVWKGDWAYVASPVAVDKSITAYAIWRPDTEMSYSIRFHRNDGSGESRTVDFLFGDKVRLPAVRNGLDWTRDGYRFCGWATSQAKAATRTIWKPDWGYVAAPVAAGGTLDAYAVWEEL